MGSILERASSKQIIEAYAQKRGVTKVEAKATLDAMTEVLTDLIGSYSKVQVSGLGVFSTKTRAARTARNPFNGGTVEVGPSTSVKFKAANGLKEALNADLPSGN